MVVRHTNKSGCVTGSCKIISYKKPVVNEYEDNYKEIFVRTNLNSFKEIPKLIYPEIINKIGIIDTHFTQFTDVVDKYIMAMISGGIDIKKYKK